MIKALQISLIAAAICSVVVSCTSPTHPLTPAQQAQVAIELFSSAGYMSQSCVTDTVGKTTQIVLLPVNYQYLDSVDLLVTTGDSTIMAKSIEIDSNKTIIDSVFLDKASDYTVRATSYRTDGSSTMLSATIRVKWLPQWKAPATADPLMFDSQSSIEALSVDSIYLANNYRLYFSTDSGKHFSTISDFDSIGAGSMKLVSHKYLLVANGSQFNSRIYVFSVQDGHIADRIEDVASNLTLAVNGEIIGYDHLVTLDSAKDTIIKDVYSLYGVDSNGTINLRNTVTVHGSNTVLYPILIRPDPVTIYALAERYYSILDYYVLSCKTALPESGGILLQGNWDAINAYTQACDITSDSSGQTVCMNYGLFSQELNAGKYFRSKTVYASNVLPNAAQFAQIVPYDSTNAFVLGTDQYVYFNSDGFQLACYGQSSFSADRLVRTFDSGSILAISFAQQHVAVSSVVRQR